MIISLFETFYHIYPISTTLLIHLICQLDPTPILTFDMFPQAIKTRVSVIKSLHQITGRKSPNLVNPLFINVLNTPYFSFLVINTTHSTWLELMALMSGVDFWPRRMREHINGFFGDF